MITRHPPYNHFQIARGYVLRTTGDFQSSRCRTLREVIKTLIKTPLPIVPFRVFRVNPAPGTWSDLSYGEAILSRK